MKKNGNSQADFILSDGTHLDVKVDKDEYENPVIISLHFFYPKNSKVPQGGISASTLREVKLEEILKNHFQKHPSFDLTTYENQFIWKFVKSELSPTGRTAYPNEYYACLSYLYVDTFQNFPNDATARLADLLGLPKRTLLSRLATARKLQILSQNSPEGPSGKAGGMLTEKGLSILESFLRAKT